MAYDGKQIKSATVANAKLATASNIAAANSVVLSGSDSKIDISYIPTDDPLLARNFSYTTLSSTDVITVPDGQTMLIANDLDIGDGTLIIDGLVISTDVELINLRPWESIVTGVGPHVLTVGKINRYDNSANAAMVLQLPASPNEGDVVDLKEVANSANAITITTASGTTLIESVSTTSDVTSLTVSNSKIGLSYKWDGSSAVWRLVASVIRSTGGTSSLIEDDLTALTTTADHDPVSSTGLSTTPSAYSTIMVYLNGVLINHISYGGRTGSLYFSNDSGATGATRGSVIAGTKLYWNGSVAGFQLTAGWVVKVVYAA